MWRTQMKRIAYVCATLIGFGGTNFPSSAFAQTAPSAAPPTISEWSGIANEIVMQRDAAQNREIGLARELASAKAQVEAITKERDALKAKYEPKPADPVDGGKK
jgi:hypothetical protein